jgi:hypothetical protein
LQPTLQCITATDWSADLSSSFNHPRGYTLLKTNEEMGEAGLASRWPSQIEPISILAPGLADARWRARAAWVQWLNNMYVYIYFAALAHAMRAVWSACHEQRPNWFHYISHTHTHTTLYALTHTLYYS